MLGREDDVRAFLGQFDHVSLEVFGLGTAIGAIWLVALDLGVILAGTALLIGSVTLIIHHRWIEISLLMIGIGLVVQIGYWIFGVPPEPFIVPDPEGIAAEVFAPGMAALILVGGMILAAVVGAWDLWEGRRRRQLDDRHRRRREHQIADSIEG